MFKLLKSGKSISVLSHTMQLLAVVTLFTEAVICLVSAHYESCCFRCQPLFNLFRRSRYWEDISISFI
ncbi:hypothetical protein [Escherichia phage EC.W2-6]|uniref:Uncharacterized protein n=1 Tax=Escherichia phage EC.W8-1 TaxID=3236638 RepID=A0AB39CBS6_9CAUD